MAISIIVILVLAGALLAAGTAIGTAAIERANPPAGKFVSVTGGRMHVVDLAPQNDRNGQLPVLLLHGATGNLQDMRLAVGDKLAATRRVILVDRPGHGWSDRPGGDADAEPARQAALVREALDAMGVGRVIVVGYSWSGSLATAFTLANPERVAGLVLVAPVTHPWPTGVAWHYRLGATRILGPLFAHTLGLPLGKLLTPAAVIAVFAPQAPPEDYVRRTEANLVLRPREFIANAVDVARLRDYLVTQSRRYGEIRAPTVIVIGDRDDVVSREIHAEAMARTVPGAELIVVPGVGHMVHHLRSDVVLGAIETVAKRAASASGGVSANGHVD